MGWGRMPAFCVSAPSVSLQPVGVVGQRTHRMRENKTQTYAYLNSLQCTQTFLQVILNSALTFELHPVGQ